MKSLKIIFFGNEMLASGLPKLAPKVFPALCANGLAPGLLILNDKEPGKKQPAIIEVSKANDIPVLYWDDINIDETVSKADFDLGIVVAFGRIIPDSVIAKFRYGIINLHPSLLPQYRGPSPIETTILNGDTISGVSIIKLTSQMDAGPILAQRKLAINKTIEKIDLVEESIRLGAKVIIKTINQIETEDVTEIVQDESEATITKKISKSDGEINQKASIAQIDRQIRAYAGWPGSFFDYDSSQITITRASLSEKDTKKDFLWKSHKQLFLSAQDGSLEITHLKLAGKSEISAVDFINSHQLPAYD